MEKMDAYSLYKEDINNIKKSDEEETKILFIMFDKLKKKLKERDINIEKVYSKLKELGFKLSYKQTDNLRNSIEFLKEKGNQEKLIENIELLQDYYEIHRILIEQNLGLVPLVIDKEFENILGNDLMDSLQEGNIALSRAVERFDIKRNIKFSSYAWDCIKYSIMSYLNENSVIRKPRYIIEVINKMSQLETEFSKEGINTSSEELGKKLRLTSKEVDCLKNIRENVLSLDRLKEIEDYYEENELYQKEAMLEDNRIDFEEMICNNEYLNQIIKPLILKLTNKQKIIMVLRFGLDLDKYIGKIEFEDELYKIHDVNELDKMYEEFNKETRPHTLSEVGKVFCLDRERIRQIEAQSLKMMRKEYTYLETKKRFF